MSYLPSRGAGGSLTTHASSHVAGGSDKVAINLLTGTVIDAQVPASAVTQHQAALSIGAAQLTGTIASARLSGAYSGITGLGALASGAVPASLVTAGSFGAGDYVFPADVTTSASFVSTGGGATGKFLTGGAGATVFAFSGANFDIRAGDGMQSSQNVLRVASTGAFDFQSNTVSMGTLTIDDTNEWLLLTDTATSGSVDLTFQNGTTGTGAAGFQVGITATEKAILLNYENTDMLFHVNNTLAATLAPGGNFTVVGAVTATTLAGTLSTATQNTVTTMTALTTIGTLVAGAVPASLVTAGTFGTGAYVFDNNVSGILTCTATAFTGTLTTGAQGNVTSLGTLTALMVSPGTTAVQLLTATSIGVGTATPQGTLHVFTGESSGAAPAVDADDVVIENNGPTGMTILSSNTQYGRISFSDDAAGQGSIIYDHGTTVGIGANAMGLVTSGSVKMVIGSSGNFDFKTGTTTFNTIAYTWPGSDGGVNNVLTTDGSGGLSWTAGGGGALGGSGTAGKIAKWSAPSTLTDSIISESGSVVTIAGTLASGALDLSGQIDLNTNNIIAGGTAAFTTLTASGNVDGPIRDKGGAVYNVVHPDYGAVDNDANDDDAAGNRVAIQAAIDAAEAAGGGVVFVPEGVFRLSPASSGVHCLTINSDNVVLEGTGYASVLKAAATQMAGILIIEAGTPASEQIKNVTIRDIHFDGNKANQSGSYATMNLRVNVSNEFDEAAHISVIRVFSHDAYAVDPSTEEGGGISLEGSDHATPNDTDALDYYKQEITIDGCFCWDNDGWGIGTNWTNGALIVNCHTYNNDTMGVTIWNSQDITVDNINSYGNAVHSLNMEISDRITIKGSHAESIVRGIKVFNSKDVILENNTIENASSNSLHHAIEVANGAGFGNGTFKKRKCERISILGNIVHQSGGSGGYALSVNDTTESLTTENVVIEENQLWNDSLPTKGLVVFSKGIQVVGNTIEGQVSLDGKVDDVVFNSNKCRATPGSSTNHLTLAGGLVITVVGNTFKLGGANTSNVIVIDHAQDTGPNTVVSGNAVLGTFSTFVGTTNTGNDVDLGTNALP
ncbi:hypothetical protein LCGC14_0967090 [marine sediment metagenome]|uniref:Right handed beta helix domain-containing protein n=1 Tax=marine sediment metagenome TaxID=412755 RepID=A0A0F9NCY2_9ZZZZ